MANDSVFRSAARPASRLQSQGKLSPAPDVVAVVLHTAWLAVLVGLAMQALLVIIGAASGQIHHWSPIIANLVQTISWSTIACVGIAIGAAISKLELRFTGLAGLLSAPIGFKVARSLAKGVSVALGLPAATGSPSLVVLGAIKAVEYGWLAVAIAWLEKRNRTSVWAHAAAGLGAGLVFGGIALSYMDMSTQPRMGMADLASRGVNEVLFPVGCALVLFASDAMGRHWNLAPAPSKRPLPRGGNGKSGGQPGIASAHSRVN